MYMEKLFEMLASVDDLVMINYSVSGFTINQPIRIVRTEKFMDGLLLCLDNEGEIFISSVICELVESSEDDESQDYYLKIGSNGVCHISFSKEK